MQPDTGETFVEVAGFAVAKTGNASDTITKSIAGKENVIVPGYCLTRMDFFHPVV